MKKLLVFVLVASLTALANGMLLDISVGGSPTGSGGPPAPGTPYDTGITLIGSQTIALDITDTQGYTYTVGMDPIQDVYWALVVAPAQGSITAGVLHLAAGSGQSGAPSASMIDDTGQLVGMFPIGSGIAGYFGYTGTDAYTTTGGLYVDGIVFHCEAPTDAVIQLWQYDSSFTTVTLADQVVIHQPEPATIALLSLGGLLLRKKR
jgi:hypothetical protein